MTKNIPRKGILLAGGAGTRLYPMSAAVSKQLLPIYDKPMIYYALATQMLAGIRDILVITTPDDENLFERLLGTGRRFGINLEYAVQKAPNGIAEALLVGRTFLDGAHISLGLGDNLFFGQGLSGILTDRCEDFDKATVFAYQVKDPSRYGVVEFDEHQRATSITEKPASPASSYAVTGLYFYPPEAVDVAAQLKPSARGELEITDVNQHFLIGNRLHVQKLDRGTAWLDTGTPQAMLQATNFVATIEERQGIRICCPEEIAWRHGWIGDDQLNTLAQRAGQSAYGQYLQSLLTGGL